MVPRPFFAKVFSIPADTNTGIYAISFNPAMTLEKGKRRESVGRKASGLSPN
jgi:hypothetical protein